MFINLCPKHVTFVNKRVLKKFCFAQKNLIRSNCVNNDEKKAKFIL